MAVVRRSTTGRRRRARCQQFCVAFCTFFSDVYNQVFTSHSDVVLRALPPAVISASLAVVAVGALVFENPFFAEYQFDITGHTVSGTLVSFLLVFRAQRAFSIYWEGRSTLGVMEQTIRDVACEVVGTLEAERLLNHAGAKKEKDTIIRYLKLYYVSVVGHLHSQLGEMERELSYSRIYEDYSCAQDHIDALVTPAEKEILDKFYVQPTAKPSRFGSGNVKIQPEEASFTEVSAKPSRMRTIFTSGKNKKPQDKKEYRHPTRSKPIIIIRWMRSRVQRCMDVGFLSDHQAQGIVSNFSALHVNYGGVSKIMGEELPAHYIQLLKLLMISWIFTIPFALASRMVWATPVVCFILALGFFGLDTVCSQMEDPYGIDQSDIDLPKRAKALLCDLNDIESPLSRPPHDFPIADSVGGLSYVPVAQIVAPEHLPLDVRPVTGQESTTHKLSTQRAMTEIIE